MIFKKKMSSIYKDVNGVTRNDSVKTKVYRTIPLARLTGCDCHVGLGYNFPVHCLFFLEQELMQLPAGFLPVGISLYDQDHIFISDWSINSLIWALQSDLTPHYAGDSVFGRINFLHSHSSANTNIGK